MANNYLTPGVYVREISALPEVAEVQSAVPAFMGYTEKTRHDGRDLKNIPEPVASFKDFTDRFGENAPLELKEILVSVDTDNRFQEVKAVEFSRRFLLHDALFLYFANGGGPCHVVSLGSFEEADFKPDPFLRAIDSLLAVDDITLLVMPEAVLLGEHLPSVQQAALAQCAKRMNRFAILDVAEESKEKKSTLLRWAFSQDKDALAANCQAFRDTVGIVNLSYGAAYTPYVIADVPVTIQYEEVNACLAVETGNPGALTMPDLDPAASESIKALDSAVYRSIVSAVQTAARVQPPSAAMAGIYASVDRQRGVWKAPANVSLSAILGLTQAITAHMQESLNVDPKAGKSINALRAFPGMGHLVWGARTLDGNSLEWRYIPVRRFFITAEESVRRGTAWAVFEPNDASLWTRLKAMLDNYLLQKWKEGALQGSSPAEAFFVNVGLGSTMTEQDILEGRLIIEMGMAMVRPAEFMILSFSHKMQQPETSLAAETVEEASIHKQPQPAMTTGENMGHPVFILTVGGKDRSGELLTLVAAHETGGIPFMRAMLAWDQDGGSGLPSPGAEVEVKAGYGNDLALRFKGVLTRTGVKMRNGERFLQLEARDKAHTLTRGLNTALHLDTTDAAVLELDARVDSRAWLDGAAARSWDEAVQGRVRIKGLHQAEPGQMLELEGLSDAFQGRSPIWGVRLQAEAGECFTDIRFGYDFPEQAAQGPAAPGLAPAPQDALETGDEKNALKGLASKSGLTLLLDEENKAITLETPGGQVIRVCDRDGEISLKDKNSNSVVMDKNGVSLQSHKDITLQAQGNITLKATREVKASGLDVKLDAQKSLSLAGTAMGELKASGPLTIKGAIVKIN